MWYRSISDMWKNDTRVQSVPTLRPLPSRTALLSSSMTNWVTTAIAKLSSGRMMRGMLNFESTVVRSETGSELVRYVERLVPMRRAERQPSQEGEQKNGGGGQRCDIDRTVFPQFASHRPVHAPTGGDDRRRGYLRFKGRPGHGV